MPTAALLERFEILDQLSLFPGCQAKPEERVVVADHCVECREPAVVEEPTLLMRPKTLQGEVR